MLQFLYRAAFVFALIIGSTALGGLIAVGIYKVENIKEQAPW